MHKFNFIKPPTDRRIDPDVRDEAERVVRDTVKACVRILSRKDTELKLKGRMDMNVKVSFSPKRSSSWGGWDGISLAIRHYCIHGMDSKTGFFEYRHFANDPTIGDLPVCSWQVALAALVCHEVAHVAQRRCYKNGKTNYRTAHGEGWQRIYAMLRRELVNPLVEVTATEPETDAMKPNKDFIVKRLAEVGKTQMAMAVALDIDRAQVTRLLNGARKVQLDEVPTMARFLDISTIEMLRNLGLDV